jgi:hypothetical protein
MTDAATTATIRLLVARIRGTQARIDQGRADLLTIIAAQPQSPLAKAVDLLDGIPGIAPWSVACLACEIGDPTRFSHAKAIIAWAGLDLIAEASGDERHDYGISHRGNTHVRAILFPLAMAGVLHNPVLKAFYHRLTTVNGKTHLEALVAVMAKLLRIAHAVMLTGKPSIPPTKTSAGSRPTPPKVHDPRPPSRRRRRHQPSSTHPFRDVRPSAGRTRPRPARKCEIRVPSAFPGADRSRTIQPWPAIPRVS